MFDTLKLRKRLTELEEVVSDLTRLVKSRDLDWEDMRARCKRLLDRTEKAARVIKSEQADTDLATQPEGGAEENGVKISSGRLLTPRQMTLQQQILLRRRA